MINQIETNDLIQKLQKEKITNPVAIEGFPELKDGILRLYNDFSLDSYIEIDQKDVIDVPRSDNLNTVKIIVLIKPSAQVKFISESRADLISNDGGIEDIVSVFKDIGPGPDLGGGGGGFFGCLAHASGVYSDSLDQCKSQGYDIGFCRKAASNSFLLSFKQCRSKKQGKAPETGGAK